MKENALNELREQYKDVKSPKLEITQKKTALAIMKKYDIRIGEVFDIAQRLENERSLHKIGASGQARTVPVKAKPRKSADAIRDDRKKALEKFRKKFEDAAKVDSTKPPAPPSPAETKIKKKGKASAKK